MSAFFEELWERYRERDKFLKRIKSEMALHGISQGRVAVRSGFQPADVSRWLNGHVRPGMETMAVLDETVELLIKGE